MAMIEKPIDQLAQALVSETQREVRDFIEFLLTKQARSSAAAAWPQGYFT